LTTKLAGGQERAEMMVAKHIMLDLKGITTTKSTPLVRSFLGAIIISALFFCMGKAEDINASHGRYTGANNDAVDW